MSKVMILESREREGSVLHLNYNTKYTFYTFLYHLSYIITSQENDISGHRLTKFIGKRADEAKVTKERRFEEAK